MRALGRPGRARCGDLAQLDDHVGHELRIAAESLEVADALGVPLGSPPRLVEVREVAGEGSGEREVAVGPRELIDRGEVGGPRLVQLLVDRLPPAIALLFDLGDVGSGQLCDGVRRPPSADARR